MEMDAIYQGRSWLQYSFEGCIRKKITAGISSIFFDKGVSSIYV
jgi:hypothetical protein